MTASAFAELFEARVEELRDLQLPALAGPRLKLLARGSFVLLPDKSLSLPREPIPDRLGVPDPLRLQGLDHRLSRLVEFLKRHSRRESLRL